MSTPPDQIANRWPNRLLVVWILLIAAVGLTSLHPPGIVPATAPANEFSADRALAHLLIIGRLPHPLGSTEHDAVRDYLLRRLTALGLHPQLQATTVVREFPGRSYRAARVQNILARLPGRSSGSALLIAAHYDSVPTGPGASDDGAAVAAMLETARALKSEPPLRNDVIFLFSDGEEAGLLGAKAFVEEHPWAKQVVVALNFEARGTNGPSLMFETSDGNSKLIHDLAQAVTAPCASSLFYSVYKRLPNDTDFTLFRKAGMSGLNFAYIENLGYYHTERDDLAHLDMRSLQHHGDTMLALARQLGDRDLEAIRASDAIYFNPCGRLLVYYPQSWVWPLALLAAMGFVVVVRFGLRTGRLHARGVRFGFLAVLAAMATVITVLILWGILGARLNPTLYSLLYSGWPVLIGVMAFAASISACITQWVSRKIGIDNVAAGGLVWWLLLTWTISALLPGGSYLFLWPFVGALIALGAGFGFSEQRNALRCLVFGLGAICALLLVIPTCCLLYTALSYVALPLIGALMALTVGLLSPLLELALASCSTLKSAWIVIAGSVVLLVWSLIPVVDAERPLVDNIVYGLDADTGKAVWASSDPASDAWTSQFLGSSPASGALPTLLPDVLSNFLYNHAESVPLTPPEVLSVQDATRDNVRTLRLRIRSPRHASCIEVVVDSDANRISAAVDGKTVVGWAQSQQNLFLMAVPAEGMELELSVKAKWPLTLRIIDRSYGLPQLPGETFTPRPPDIIPKPSSYWFTDTTLVSKRYTF